MFTSNYPTIRNRAPSLRLIRIVPVHMFALASCLPGVGKFPVGQRGARLIERQPAVPSLGFLCAMQGCWPARVWPLGAAGAARSRVQRNRCDAVMSESGLVSRVSPVQTALRNCTRDEGRSFEVGNQVLISSHRKLLLSKAMVVNVAETSGLDSDR